MTNGFALNHNKSLQIYFFCVKRQVKNDFLKDVESTVGYQAVFFLNPEVQPGRPKPILVLTV